MLLIVLTVASVRTPMCFAEDTPVLPGKGGGMGVVVKVDGVAIELAIRPPVTKDVSVVLPVPADYTPDLDRTEPWSGGPKERPTSVALSPRHDEQGTLILGGLYRQILPASVRVRRSADGVPCRVGQDYRYQPDWGCVAAIDGRLGVVGRDTIGVDFTYATQRIDLVQADATGRVTIKAGTAVMVCPQIPEPDAGARAVAGIYVAPWQRDGRFVIMAEDIFPIRAARPTQPIHVEAVAGAVRRLRVGQELKVAIVGDSVSLGAEAGNWWDGLWTAGNTSYASRLVTGLRQQYPMATVTPIHAVKGGRTVKAAKDLFDAAVAPAKANLVLIAFGLNDANGDIGQPPRNPPAAYKEDVRALVRTSRAIGAEVILVTPMQPNPFLKNKIADRIPAYRQALVELADEERVGCADVYSEWLAQADRGVPPFSQLHNWINHPGPDAHKIYADTLLRFFARDRHADAAATTRSPSDVPGLIGFWTFQEPPGQDRVAVGPNAYRLRERAGAVARVDGGVFGPFAMDVREGQWLGIARADCPALDRHGPDAGVTVVAWVKRRAASWNHCEAVAGVWDETRGKRQYGLFLNLGIWDSAQQVGGHVSGVGGPTPGYKYCMDAAITDRAVPLDEWHCVGFTYDGKTVRAYLDGKSDTRPGRNPYPYAGGLFDGGPAGADFTVGAVSHGGKMGNFFAGLLGGLAVFDRALSDATMLELATPPGR